MSNTTDPLAAARTLNLYSSDDAKRTWLEWTEQRERETVWRHDGSGTPDNLAQDEYCFRCGFAIGRIGHDTEQTMHAAWRKRAEEAEERERAYERTTREQAGLNLALADENKRLADELAQMKAIQVAVEQTPKQFSTARAPTLEAILATASHLQALENNKRLTAEIVTLREDRDKLQAFKDWCHSYLDGKGIPHHPPGTHGAAGCRIGDRMDYVFAEMERLRNGLAAAIRVMDAHQTNRSTIGYVSWANAGGPKECKHGYAAGIDCPMCDEETARAALAAAPPPGAGTDSPAGRC